MLKYFSFLNSATEEEKPLISSQPSRKISIEPNLLNKYIDNFVMEAKGYMDSLPEPVCFEGYFLLKKFSPELMRGHKMMCALGKIEKEDESKPFIAFCVKDDAAVDNANLDVYFLTISTLNDKPALLLIMNKFSVYSYYTIEDTEDLALCRDMIKPLMEGKKVFLLFI